VVLRTLRRRLRPAFPCLTQEEQRLVKRPLQCSLTLPPFRFRVSAYFESLLPPHFLNLRFTISNLKPFEVNEHELSSVLETGLGFPPFFPLNLPLCRFPYPSGGPFLKLLQGVQARDLIRCSQNLLTALVMTDLSLVWLWNLLRNVFLLVEPKPDYLFIPLLPSSGAPFVHKSIRSTSTFSPPSPHS